MADITKVKAEVAVDAVFDAMRISMQRGERIELRGFGVFGETSQARHWPQPTTGRKSGFHPADYSIQARQRPPEHRIIDRLEPVRRDPQAVPPPFEFVGGPPEYVWHPPRKFRDRVWLHVVLLLATILSTTLVGELHYASFVSDFGVHQISLTGGALSRGAW
jgi:hypothetical protein